MKVSEEEGQTASLEALSHMTPAALSNLTLVKVDAVVAAVSVVVVRCAVLARQERQAAKATSTTTTMTTSVFFRSLTTVTLPSNRRQPLGGPEP